MSRRRQSARKQEARARGRREELPDYYARTGTDASFLSSSQKRVKARARRQWLIRLALVVILVAAGYLLGPTLIKFAESRGKAASQDVGGVARQLQEGRDRRSGVGLEEQSR